ncbi:MAG: sigma-54 dependent transcriptional regulator [Puniceicoccaceae bacterium]
MPATILIVDDERHTREGLEAALEDQYEIYLASDADEAFNLLDSESFDVVLTDLRMAGKSGMKVIDHALKKTYQPVCIMMTAYGNIETAVEAMKRGAYDFMTKPVNLEKLEIMIARALKSKELEVENQILHERLDHKFSLTGIIGNSPALHQVLDRVKLVAPSRAAVLLQGETGTGKELVAQSIHQNSPRAKNNFIAVHCAALASNLLESELFGHEKGAFTGATERRMGRFEAADGGTLFLDEIGEIEPSTQVKLLRFLDTKTFERLGSIKPIQVDVRLVCATNRDLEKMAKKGEFRDDLLYRLNTVTLNLPPLRERKEDIPLLLNHYLKSFSEENGFDMAQLTPEALQILQNYRWPGNIRELRNVCENLVVLNPGRVIGEYDLDSRFHSDTGNTVSTTPLPAPGLSVEANEKRLLHNALVQSKGNRTQAAKLLGISRRTLHRKLLQWPDLDTHSRASKSEAQE